jgi:hypothetical protein
MGKIEWFLKYRYTVPGPFFCEDQELLLRSYRDSRLDTLNELLFAYRIRGKVDWQKLSRTRRTIFIAQVRHFANLNLWHFVLLATAAFVGKMSSDFSKKVRGTISLPGRDIIDDAIAFEWQKIFESLTAEPKAR